MHVDYLEDKTDECYKVGLRLKQRGLAPLAMVLGLRGEKLGVGIRSLLSLFSFMDHPRGMPKNTILTFLTNRILIFLFKLFLQDLPI